MEVPSCTIITKNSTRWTWIASFLRCYIATKTMVIGFLKRKVNSNRYFRLSYFSLSWETNFSHECYWTPIPIPKENFKLIQSSLRYYTFKPRFISQTKNRLYHWSFEAELSGWQIYCFCLWNWLNWIVWKKLALSSGIVAEFRKIYNA